MNEQLKQNQIQDILVSGDYYMITGNHEEDSKRPAYFVVLGKPEVDKLSPPENTSYYCPFSIEIPKGSNEVVYGSAFGINALQAIELAYVKIKLIILDGE